MGNISNFNVNKVDMRLSNYDYWDLYLADGDFSIIPQDTIISGDCLVAHYDFNNLAIYGGAPYSDVYTPQYGDINGDGHRTLYSLTTWNDAVNTGYTLDTVGLTGIDNGLISFDKTSGDTGNTALVSALTGTTLVIASGETRLCLTKVSGMTGNYVYPIEIVPNTGSTVGTYSKLCGGFYQGYYKLDGNSYEVLPNRVPKTWTAEVWLRKPCEDECSTFEDATYSNVPLLKKDSQRTVVVTIENHGMSVGDIIVITATTDDDMFLPSASPQPITNFTLVTTIIDDNSFEYQGSTNMIGFNESGTGTITLYDTTCYSGVSLTKFAANEIEVPLTGLTTSDYVHVTDITPTGVTDGFIVSAGHPVIPSYGLIESSSPTGFTYTTENLTLPVPEYATGTVCTYSVRQIETSGTILNDNYTGNTGFFLYFGTRAENKFWNIFEGLNTGTTSGCTSGATEWCTIPKETDVSVVDDNGNVIPLSPPPVDLTVTDNKFLFFSRARATSGGNCSRCGQVHEDGYTTCSWTGGTGGTVTLRSIRTKVTDDRNPFLIYSRAQASSSSGSTCGRCGGDHPAGETVCSYSGNTAPLEELDRDADLIDNALGFRITPEGAIGYRKLVVTATCINNVTVTGCSVEESYSADGIIDCDAWKMISIRFVANETLDECELEWRPARKGKLMFYVNRRLIHVVEDFDEFIARRLMEHSVKQVAVPYNISLGGGTQGLIEEMTFDGQDPDDMGSCLQNNFAGTFIGDLSQFRFYICGMNYCDIKNNFEKERERYGLSIND